MQIVKSFTLLIANHWFRQIELIEGETSLKIQLMFESFNYVDCNSFVLYNCNRIFNGLKEIIIANEFQTSVQSWGK